MEYRPTDQGSRMITFFVPGTEKTTMEINEIQWGKLVERLAGLSDMVLAPGKESIGKYLKGLETTLGPNLENYGNVKSSDAPEPQPLGVQGKDGFRPLVFTTQELASSYARRQ